MFVLDMMTQCDIFLLLFRFKSDASQRVISLKKKLKRSFKTDLSDFIDCSLNRKNREIKDMAV